VQTLLKARLLGLILDVQPVLDQCGPRMRQSQLKTIDGGHELLVLGVGAEAHDSLDAGAVVPAAVEEDHLAGRGQMRHVALEIPLRLLALGRCGQGHDPSDAGVEALRDALDGSTLAGGITTLEQDHQFLPRFPDPRLELEKFDLQLVFFFFIILVSYKDL